MANVNDQGDKLTIDPVFFTIKPDCPTSVGFNDQFRRESTSVGIVPNL
jgi:hypothetical protein